MSYPRGLALDEAAGFTVHARFRAFGGERCGFGVLIAQRSRGTVSSSKFWECVQHFSELHSRALRFIWWLVCVCVCWYASFSGVQCLKVFGFLAVCWRFGLWIDSADQSPRKKFAGRVLDASLFPSLPYPRSLSLSLSLSLCLSRSRSRHLQRLHALTLASSNAKVQLP